MLCHENPNKEAKITMHVSEIVEEKLDKTVKVKKLLLYKHKMNSRTKQ